MFNKNTLNLYFICGTSDVPHGQHITNIVKEALESGITLFQFREKGPNALKGKDKENLANQLKVLCHEYNVPFIVNDDVELAKNINADGIHVGQDDEDVATFAKEFKNKIIGLSVGNLTELAESNLSNVDYIGVGPIYATPSKEDASQPVGAEMIQLIRDKVNDFSIVAIGGINENNVKAVVDAGTDGVSVISAIAKSSNIRQTVNKILENFN